MHKVGKSSVSFIIREIEVLLACVRIVHNMCTNWKHIGYFYRVLVYTFCVFF